MALREDYHTPCIEEINRRIKLIDQIIDDVKPSHYHDHLGMENSRYIDDMECTLDDIIKKLEDMKEILYDERKKIAYNVGDVKG